MTTHSSLSNRNGNTVAVKSQFAQSRLVRLSDGKVIGELRNGIFYKFVVGSKHKLRTPEAWCLSAKVFEEEVLPTAREIIIEDRESGLVYRCSVEVFSQHSFELCRGGFEKQRALLVKYWQLDDGNRARQLSLFPGGGS